jgi:hypothetical protein
MASDYNAIRADNERRYGTDIGRIGPMLLADGYDDRTHFIGWINVGELDDTAE